MFSLIRSLLTSAIIRIKPLGAVLDKRDYFVQFTLSRENLLPLGLSLEILGQVRRFVKFSPLQLTSATVTPSAILKYNLLILRSIDIGLSGARLAMAACQVRTRCSSFGSFSVAWLLAIA